MDRRGTRTAWKKVDRELEATIEAGIPGLARVHALLALPEALATERRRILVVFDEFQDLLTAGEDLDGLIRSHVQHHSGVASYCYAGSQPSLMRALFEDRQRPLFGQAREVTLSPFATEAVADWVGRRFEAGGRPVPAESSHALADGVAGHPQRAAMVAHFLWGQARLDEAGVRAAEAEALGAARGELEQLWSGLTRPQRQVLGAVADGETKLLSASALESMGLEEHGAAGPRRTRGRGAPEKQQSGHPDHGPFLAALARSANLKSRSFIPETSPCIRKTFLLCSQRARLRNRACTGTNTEPRGSR